MKIKGYVKEDTIAAISTGAGEAGIGIIRISGKNALSVADRIFYSADNSKPSEFKTYTTHYGWIINRRASKENNSILDTQCSQQDAIDEVLLTVMRAPKSYTREDIVEINCHGGIVALRRCLDLVIDRGCRPAEPGEFTKRAFLNGRIDLAQAEAVLDIIRAKTEDAMRAGVNQLQGALGKKITGIRSLLLGCLAELEANIDFPEDSPAEIDSTDLRKKLIEARKSLLRIYEGSFYADILREGVHVVICGRPNAGKSSLLNALLKKERSIVTSVPGTTRDTIEEIIDIKGIPVRIVDTAGILEPRDIIEKKAVLRSRQQIDSADLVILLFDASRAISRDESLLIKKLKGKKVLAVINKMDLKSVINRQKIIACFGRVIDISAKKQKNIGLLEDELVNLVYGGRIKPSLSDAIAGSARQAKAIKDSEKLIAEALKLLDNKVSFEFISQEIKDALMPLDMVLGKDFSKDLLNTIFSRFCIGK